ncbi:MAG: UDP-N-acetylmuramoyl-L-alanine--D-glutamate ligase [Deltaproteobacteria bacterium]|nr:UDP-N-acetylmuramoyl-L-alanine--D-glutamate ligase [Deltaproteobacteria bacterium]
MTEFEGQSVLVLGLGVSGVSATRFLVERGARVTAADERAPDAIAGMEDLPATAALRVGEAFPDLDAFDLVVPSPGVPAARYAGCRPPVLGDIELCFRALPVPIIAVTGTNGKSTVVKLIEAMARGAGLRAQAAGNVGLPALELAGRPLDLAILEVSSFQLESIEAFSPRTGVLLNLTPDHLDRHGDMAGYRAAKARLFARQGAGQTAIVNGDDPLCADLEIQSGVERLEFRRRTPVEAGAWMDGANAIVRRGGTQQVFQLEGATALSGQADNVLAALLALSTVDVELDRAARVLAEFTSLPHRCQHVATIHGARFVDDSKATNVGAAARSLASFEASIVWIAGGRHKGGDLRSLRDAARGRVRRALLIGEAAGEFEAALSDVVACEGVEDLDTAVARAGEIAHDGDVVLLAPACASFDQFDSFEARGRAFQRAVHELTPPSGESQENAS